MSSDTFDTYRALNGATICARSVEAARLAAKQLGITLLIDATKIERDAYMARFGKHYKAV